MAQLVGQPCSICGGRIGTEFESSFCAKCHHPVHNRCRVPASTTDTCSECGTNLAEAARQAEERARQLREEEARRPPPPPLEVERAFHFYKVARWFVGAAVAVMIGIGILASGEPGATPVGVGAIGAGVAMAFLGTILARDR